MQFGLAGRDLKSAPVISKIGGLTMVIGQAPIGFATRATYFLVAAVVLVFVCMLALTVLHP
jgi:uncharacterized membrane protein